jgi:hypothetical protein
MSSNFSSSNLSDKDFVLAFADEFFGDQLDDAEKKRFESLAEKEDSKKLLDRYKEEHGELQVFLQGVCLNPEQMEELWNLVQAPEARQTQEMKKIDEVGRLEFLGNLRKRSVVTLFFAALIFSIVYAFTSEQAPKFEYLEYIRYEALAMDRSGTISDFDLADPNPSNILDVYKLDKGLKFTPSILSLADQNWVITGGSILDYELKKITMAQYETRSSDDDKLYYFSTSGALSELPKSEIGREGELSYQTYSSEFYNIIAFEPAEATLGFVVGRLSAPEMAKLVDKGLVK